MRIVALASLLLLPSAGCGTSSEEDHGAVELGEAPPAVTYTEMRLTPRGTQSGLQEDLFPFRLGQAEDPVAAETAYWNVDLERRADLKPLHHEEARRSYARMIRQYRREIRLYEATVHRGSTLDI